jgi:hypothetical protein
MISSQKLWPLDHEAGPLMIHTGWPKKGELLKCVVAAMYSWQHCRTGTLSYRQPRHLVSMDQWNGEHRAVVIKNILHVWIFQKFLFFWVTLYTSIYNRPSSYDRPAWHTWVTTRRPVKATWVTTHMAFVNFNTRVCGRNSGHCIALYN